MKDLLKNILGANAAIVLCTGLAFLLSVCISACSSPTVNDMEIVGHTRAAPILEFEHDGCQYLRHDRGIAHKGNCDNPIHCRMYPVPAEWGKDTSRAQINRDKR